MSNQSYTASTSVDQSPKEAFEAIRNVRGWWSEEIEGSTAKVGDEFKYQYEHNVTASERDGLTKGLGRKGLLIFSVVLGKGRRLFKDGIAGIDLRLVD
jgi:hypothetical protein